MFRLNPLTRFINRMAGPQHATLPPLIVDPAELQRRTVSSSVMRAIYGRTRSVRKGTQSQFLRKRGSYGYRCGLPPQTVHHITASKAEQYTRNGLLQGILNPYV
jgi:hypothetical protein